MKKIVFLSAAALISTCAMAQTDRAAYKSAWEKAESDYKVAKDKCSSLKGNAKDVCKEEAKVAQAKSELDITTKYKNNPSDVTRAEHRVAEAEYDLAKEKCDDMSGSAKSTCKSDAKSQYDTQLASTKTSTTENVADKTREKSADASLAMSDTMITTKVKAEMAADPVVKAMDVHVETQGGVVMLSGFVPSKTEADKAVEIARAVKGVTDVKSSIQVKK
ncbi:BON domain-containing protein [Pseudoduganella sp. RAF53_2]|uniref:BON domain-containing protein n=1 Tax=unclassified Pseudoduganella TaxID=2637179 RepID=UPI003F94FCD3